MRNQNKFLLKWKKFKDRESRLALFRRAGLERQKFCPILPLFSANMENVDRMDEMKIFCWLMQSPESE